MAALARLPEDQRKVVVAHVEALVGMSDARRSALLMLAREGSA